MQEVTPYSQLRSLPRVDLAAESPLDRPLTIYAEVTNRCNLRCRMCPESHPRYAEIAGGIRRMSEADMALVRNGIAELGGVKTLYLHSLGEPMLNRLTPHFIADVRPLVERVCLTTNGTVSLTRLLDCPPDYVRVSIYGLSQDEFEATTQATIDHRLVFDNLKELHAERERRKQALPFIYVKGFGKFSPLHHRLRDYCDEVDVEPTMDWNGEGGEWGTRGEGAKHACPAPFYMMCIHADLRVSVCGVDWSKRLVVGNLKEQSLKSIWHGDELKRIRLAHLSGQRCSLDGCRNCTYLHTTLPDSVDALTADEYEKRTQKEMAPCESV